MEITEIIKSIDKGYGKYKIYAILTIENKELIYVGITKKSLGFRLSGHKGSNYFNRKDICISLITKTDDFSMERYYITYFKNLGYNLLNKHSIKEKTKKERIKKKISQEEKKEKSKQYYQINKDAILENHKQWLNNNREKWNEYQKEYKKKKIKNF